MAKYYEDYLMTCADCPQFGSKIEGGRLIGSYCYYKRKIITPLSEWKGPRIEYNGGFPEWCPLEDVE